MVRFSCLVLVLVLVLSLSTVGAETLPPRRAGELDIHHISTGLGDQTLFVLPDGTTLLVDTGDVAAFFADRGTVPPSFETWPRPDGSRTAGEWVARYIERVTSEKALDYLLLTHFHPDHMLGLGDVTSRIDVDVVFDRGWPDYGEPVPVQPPLVAAYREVVKDSTVTRFRPGRADQIVLRRHPDEYANFEIRNLTANGEYWTGEGVATKLRFPPLSELAEEDYPNENMSSLSFRLRYGAFGYFTGGDLPGVPEPGYPEWHSIEAAIAKAVGPIDVHALNHHGGGDAGSVEFLAELRPRVHVVSTFAPSQGSPTTIRRLLSERIYEGPRDVFVLQYRKEAKAAFGNRPPTLQSESGHVVVRVEAGGARYRVYVVSDADESGTILATHGPYRSRALH